MSSKNHFIKSRGAEMVRHDDTLLSIENHEQTLFQAFIRIALGLTLHFIKLIYLRTLASIYDSVCRLYLGGLWYICVNSIKASTTIDSSFTAI